MALGDRGSRNRKKTCETGARAASEEDVQASDLDRSTGRAAVVVLIALFFCVFVLPANARTRHHRKPNPITVALQPFLVARSVVHAVAEPIVSHAPRAIAAVATAPIRIAYQSTHEPEIRRSEVITEVATPNYNQPFRVAYMVPRTQRPARPNPELSEEGDQDFAPEPEAELGAGESNNGPTVADSRAALRGGIAYAPARAPQSVKNAIWAANNLRRKPYAWGGGHGSFQDRGYDCSGTVSYALRGSGAIAAPLSSNDLMRYGERGRGRWITIYARRGHTFAVIAGLRLDTTDFQNGGNTGPRWHAEMRDTRGYIARHPAGM